MKEQQLVKENTLLKVINGVHGDLNWLLTNTFFLSLYFISLGKQNKMKFILFS